MPRFESEFEQWEFEQRVQSKMKRYSWHDKSRGYKNREWAGTDEEFMSYMNQLAERNRLLWQDLVFSAHEVDRSLGSYYNQHTRRKPIFRHI